MINYFKFILKFTIGVIIIALIFWQRVLRERTPQIFGSEKEMTYALYLSLILCVIFLSLLSLELFKKESSSLFNYKYIVLLREKLQFYVAESPEYVYEQITRNINLQKYIEYPASYFAAYVSNIPLFVITLYFAPQMIIALILLFETLLLQQRVYFYKSLYLILILLIAKTVIFVFNNYSFRRIQHLEQFLEVVKGPKGTEICLKGPEQVPQHISYEVIVNNYNNMFNSWFIYSTIKSCTDEVISFNKLYVRYVRIFTYSCFSIAWLYTFF